MRREGSPFKGVGTVALKDAAVHRTSARSHLIMLLVLLTAIGAVYGAIDRIRDTTAQDAYLFLKLFTVAREPLPSLPPSSASCCRWWRSRSASTPSTASSTGAP